MKLGKVQHWTPFDIYLISCQMLACLIAWHQDVSDVPIFSQGTEAVDICCPDKTNSPNSRTASNARLVSRGRC